MSERWELIKFLFKQQQIRASSALALRKDGGSGSSKTEVWYPAAEKVARTSNEAVPFQIRLEKGKGRPEAELPCSSFSRSG